MFWRRDVIREAATGTRNQTYKLDLPDHGLLSSLLLRMSAEGVSDLKYATGGKWRLLDYLTKVAVMGNGTTTIKDITGLQMSAMCWFDQGVMPPDIWRNYSTQSQWIYMLINFGRYFLDPQAGLNLTPWDNVQLQITNDATSSEFGQDIATTVIGFFQEEGPGFPLGYMRTEEYKSWTTAQNAWEYTDLPTEEKLRRLLIQLTTALDSNNIFKTSIDNLADDVKLTLGSGAVQIYRGGIDDIVRENQMDFGNWVITHAQPNIDADKGFYMGVGRIIGRMGIAGSKSGAVLTVVPTAEADRSDDTQKFEARDANGPIQYTVMGQCPHRMVALRYDQSLDPVTWLDLAAKKTVSLDIHTRDHADAASGKIAIVLDRLVPGKV